jgi:pimeloyl-ACP methyl ester carboxylesterase
MVAGKVFSVLPLLGLALGASIRLDARQSDGSSNSSSTAGPYGLSNADCSNVTLSVPINITLTNFTGVDNTYSNQSYITKQVIEFTQAQANWTSEHVSNTTFALNRTFSIAGTYCKPRQGGDNDVLINLVHGIGFDSSYWDFAFSPEYSVVKVAASYGYATFRYDRIGTGKSETPVSGFQVARAQTEVAILQGVLGQLRNSTTVGGKQHDKIVGVGHSYGSVQTQAVTAQSPQLLDAAILTGFTTNSSNLGGYLTAGSYSIANRIFPDRLGDKPDTWLVTGSNASDITGFFFPPNYAQEAFDLARATEQPVTLGSLFTVGDVGGVAQNFTGPVQVVNGANDFIFCSSNCWAGPNGTDIPSGVKMLYPAASNFTSYIAEKTGHGITAHYSQPEVAREIVTWIQSQNL